MLQTWPGRKWRLARHRFRLLPAHDLPNRPVVDYLCGPSKSTAASCSQMARITVDKLLWKQLQSSQQTPMRVQMENAL